MIESSEILLFYFLCKELIVSNFTDYRILSLL